ncbi:MAG: DNA alkylation repair protein [Pseudomonadota bacterium]
MSHRLRSAIKQSFADAADPERAAGQQAYMKSEMPYYGIPAADMRRLAKAVFDAHPLPDRESWTQAVLTLWRDAEFREERYAALTLIDHKPYRRYYDVNLLALLDELIVSGAWWDFIDPIASNYVGALLREHRAAIEPQLLVWAEDDNHWRRRSAILAQLKFKADTDWPLQQRFMAPSLEEREFFLRKAIGWALREYSKTDPEAVLAYVRGHAKLLSGLSKREGLKVLLKTGQVAREDPLFA